MPISLWSTVPSTPLMPGSVSHNLCSRSANCGLAVTIAGVCVSCVWRAMSAQRLQKGADRIEIGARHVDLRHQIAWLHPLRIGDPAGEMAGRVRQRARRDRAATHHMGEIAADLAA